MRKDRIAGSGSSHPAGFVGEHNTKQAVARKEKKIDSCLS